MQKLFYFFAFQSITGSSFTFPCHQIPKFRELYSINLEHPACQTWKQGGVTFCVNEWCTGSLTKHSYDELGMRTGRIYRWSCDTWLDLRLCPATRQSIGVLLQLAGHLKAVGVEFVSGTDYPRGGADGHKPVCLTVTSLTVTNTSPHPHKHKLWGSPNILMMQEQDAISQN